MGQDPKKATGLGAINYAFNGESKDNDEIVVDYGKTGVDSADQEYVIFKPVSNTRKGGLYIPNIDDVINPETKKEERMRLLVGVSSVWMKDQKDLDKDYIRQNAKSLCIPRGAKCLRIKKTDEAALTFARLTRHNVGGINGFKGSNFGFYEYDAAKEAQAALDRELLELDMAIVVKGLSTEMVKKYMAFLKLPVYDQISGQVKNDDLLKRELMLYAKRNPIDFQKLTTERSKEIELSHLVNKMILEAKIDISSQPGRAFWANGGGLIGVIPTTRKPNEYLTELALTNTEEGREFLKQLNASDK